MGIPLEANVQLQKFSVQALIRTAVQSFMW